MAFFSTHSLFLPFFSLPSSTFLVRSLIWTFLSLSLFPSLHLSLDHSCAYRSTIHNDGDSKPCTAPVTAPGEPTTSPPRHGQQHSPLDIMQFIHHHRHYRTHSSHTHHQTSHTHTPPSCSFFPSLARLLHFSSQRLSLNCLTGLSHARFKVTVLPYLGLLEGDGITSARWPSGCVVLEVPLSSVKAINHRYFMVPRFK